MYSSHIYKLVGVFVIMVLDLIITFFHEVHESGESYDRGLGRDTVTL